MNANRKAMKKASRPLSPEEKRARLNARSEQARAASAAARTAAADHRVRVWLAQQPERTCSLAAELFTIQEARSMPVGFRVGTRAAAKGRAFVVACANGYHESYASHEHALELLVESLRTRAEDTEEAQQLALEAIGSGDHKEAHRLCANVARRVRTENPDSDASTRDALVIAALRARRDAALTSEPQ